MKKVMAELKSSSPDMSAKERFAEAVRLWNVQKKIAASKATTPRPRRNGELTPLCPPRFALEARPPLPLFLQFSDAPPLPAPPNFPPHRGGGGPRVYLSMVSCRLVWHGVDCDQLGWVGDFEIDYWSLRHLAGDLLLPVWFDWLCVWTSLL
jgi:hypothetical protein